MTLKQYQEAASIYQTKENDIERIAWCICIVFNKRPDKVNEWKKWKFFFYSRLLAWKFKHVIIERRQRIDIITDASEITLGQFIDAEHFLKQESLHLVAATIWRHDGKHHEKAKRINELPAKWVVPALTKFTESYMQLLKSYAGLFEITDEVMEGEPSEPHPFQEQYGWVYSTKAVADFEGITLNEAYDLPIIQALNDLAYLKSYKAYQDEKNTTSSNRRRLS